MDPESTISTFTGLEIRILGPLEVKRNGEALPLLRSRKAQILLAWLALRPHTPQESLFIEGKLWPNSVASNDKTANVRTNLNSLRDWLGEEYFLRSRSTVQLDISKIWVDTLAFDEAVKRGDPDSLKYAWNLYRGPLLDGFNEDWIEQPRHDYAATFLRINSALPERPWRDETIPAPAVARDLQSPIGITSKSSTSQPRFTAIGVIALAATALLGYGLRAILSSHAGVPDIVDPLRTVIIDDLNKALDSEHVGFCKWGPGPWHSVEGLGVNEEMQYARNTHGAPGKDQCVAQWRPKLPHRGQFEIFAFIPRNHATTQHAHYDIYVAGAHYKAVYINQLAFHDQWVSLGTYPLYNDNGDNVLLYSETSEPAGSKQVGYDAVKFVPRSPPMK